MGFASQNDTKFRVAISGLQTPFAPPSTALTVLFGCLFIWWLLLSWKKKPFASIHGNYNFDAPIVGSKNPILGRWQFYRNGPALIREGYAKYRDTFFKVSANDLIIVPNQYAAELASLPPETLSLNTAIVDAFQNLHSITAVITDNSLQSLMITAKLTPQLGAHIPRVQAQLRTHLPQELPAAVDRWTSVEAVALARRLVHRGVATQFVSELAENEAYLATTVSYSEYGFMHNLLLRVFPDWAKRAVALVLPTGWRVDAALRKAKRLVIPVIRERRRREAGDVDYEKPDDFLQHLMDGGVEIHDDDDTTVRRLMVTYLGAGPSIIIAVAQALFDLCAHPEYVGLLRDEVIEVLRGSGGYTRQALADMKRLDSFMRESQRLSPPTQRNFNTIVRQPVVLHDGVILPEGAHIQMATHSIGVDPDQVTDPDVFDGLRHYNNRKRPGEENWHQFTTTSETNLHFGHGKIACPGRFFSDCLIKMILSNILIKYHLRFVGGGTERPANTSMYDVVIPDLNTRVEFKLREDACTFTF